VKALGSKANLLEMAVWLIQHSKEGDIRLQTNGTENIQLHIENHKADLDFLQKELLRNLLDLRVGMGKASILDRLKALENLAGNLKAKGLTLTISHKNRTILTLGKAAHPTISQMVTGTAAIEINNIIELVKLVK
jgi:hypothetical protein